MIGRTSRRQGFTLMEIMLASGMLTVLMVSTYTLLSQARAVAQMASSGFDQDRGHIIALRRLEILIRAAAPYRQIEEDIDFHGDTEDLRFTTFDYRPPGKPGMPASIHLGQDGDGVFLEIMPLGFLQSESQRQDSVLLERLPQIENFELEYFDGENWKSEWNFRKLLRLPKAMRLKVQFLRLTRAKKVQRVPAELVIPLPLERDVGIR